MKSALKVARAPLSPEREALRSAIAVHVEADRVARTNTEAHQRAEMAVVDSYGPEVAAEAALQKAKTSQPARLAAEFRGDLPEPGPTVAEAEATLAAVLQKRADTRAARDALDGEASHARTRASWKRDAVKVAAGLVVKASPEARALADAFAEAERRYASLRQAVQVLALQGALPDGVALNTAQPVDRSSEMAWIGAFEALAVDPAASLPPVP